MTDVTTGTTGATDTELGVVIVGTGFGCLTHLPAFRDAGFEVRALVGRDPEKTRARAERFGVPHAFTSLTEALALDGVDAVSVATPPHTHADLVIEAVEAGKHVVCEKPFAADAEQARRMLDAAEKAGVVHLLGTEFRWSTPQALLRRVVAEGAVGTPTLATWLLHIPVLAGPDAEVPEWWGRAEDSGGWLGAHATHWIDQVEYTLGAIEGVSAGLPIVSDRPGQTAEDTFNIRFRTVTGVEGTLQSSGAVYGPPQMITRVAGTHGTAWVEFEDVWLGDAEGDRKVPVPDDLANPAPEPPPGDLLHTAYDLLHCMGIDRAPYARLAGTFRDLILGCEVPADPPYATFADGVANQLVLDAVRRSAAEGRWVAVER
ncbi:Gfo/Idh/MocA family protein [Yinghuangia seranimata]|uniref:Gfo/Idh/MocA family protein n=1 Tax=Yinghuangia seranimata TaxID=408067 RepID=UPI00248D0CC0|nr:Gfo/Idh/MocA family oxidoreductase [Yinghuangia seranimata]MDI2128041.1 Gfo/Idh/MocA family oxidoreductase [Yinghuangia seranimata]